jgi:hypothetical protein
VAFALWKGHGLATIGEVEDAFARLCMGANFILGEPAAARYFLNRWDDNVREQARRELLEEVERTLAERGTATGQPAA